MIRQQRSHVHCRYGAWRAQRYVVFCLNTRASVTVMTTSWTKESNFYKIKPLLIVLLQRKVHHRVCQSLICSSEKSEPHLFPYSRVVVHFVACCGYNVDRWSFAPKDGVSRQKTRPNVLLPRALCIMAFDIMLHLSWYALILFFSKCFSNGFLPITKQIPLLQLWNFVAQRNELIFHVTSTWKCKVWS